MVETVCCAILPRRKKTLHYCIVVVESRRRRKCVALEKYNMMLLRCLGVLLPAVRDGFQPFDGMPIVERPVRNANLCIYIFNRKVSKKEEEEKESLVGNNIIMTAHLLLFGQNAAAQTPKRNVPAPKGPPPPTKL